MDSGPASPAAGCVARVRRELLATCMTCPLCHGLLRDATTISECLHTFCRKCIFKKLTDEEFDCCPICNIDLGCVPVEKLRADHNLQDIRNKIFPLKRKKINAPETPSIVLPVRRKERSLSSLVVSTPRVSTQNGLTGRRSRAARRIAAARGLRPSSNESAKERNGSDAQDQKNGSCPSAYTSTSHNKKQNHLDAEPSNQPSHKDEENGLNRSELWKPLNCLVEAANITKTLKSIPQGIHIKEEGLYDSYEVKIPKTEGRDHLKKLKYQAENNGNASSSPLSRGRKSRRKKECTVTAQALLDAACTPRDRMLAPIWFSLVPSGTEGDAQLPHLSANYLRIKDGNLPISSIQKYVIKKLGLEHEDEVEIVCRDQTMSSTMTLHDLLDIWLKAELREKTQTSVGSSGKDYVMVLTYRRRVSSP